jgi:hypothetical protein
MNTLSKPNIALFLSIDNQKSRSICWFLQANKQLFGINEAKKKVSFLRCNYLKWVLKTGGTLHQFLQFSLYMLAYCCFIK